MNAQYSLPTELPNLGRADRIARRRAQVHPARGVERAGQRLRAGRGRRLHRRRSHVRLRAREGAAVPHARRREPRSAAGGARSVDHGRRSTSSASARWASAAASSLIGCKIGALNRLPASFFVSVAYDCWAFRRLGVVLDAQTRRDQASGSIATRRRRSIADGRSGRASSGPAARSRLRTPLDGGAGPRAEGRRRRAGLGPRVHRPRRRARIT